MSAERRTLLIVGLAIGIITGWLLAGCTTVENEDGTRTTRVDTEAISEGTKAAGDIYDRYRASQRPAVYSAPAYYPPPQPMVNPYTGQAFYPYR